MSPEDELAELWQHWTDTRDPEAFDLLTRRYLRLAGYLARRACAKAPPYQDPEDILSYAHHGLLDAIRRFDPSKGVKFETYATRRISGTIIDGQRQQDPLTRATRRKVKAMQVVIDELWDELARDPSPAEVASRLGVAEGDVRETLLAQKSLNGSLDADDETERTLGVGGDAEVSSHITEIRQQVAMRLAGLSDRGLAFTLVHYCDDLSMRDAAEQLGIAADWCRQTRTHVVHALTGNPSGNKY